MPSNTVTNANTAAAFKGSDFTDSPGNRMGESTILDMDLMAEEKSSQSSASCKVGKPGRKRKQFAVESCGSLRDGVGNSYSGVGRPSMAQIHNGDMGGHRDRMSDACFPKQEKREVENGIPREPSSCRAEDSSQGRSLSPSQENGFVSSREEPDSEIDKDESLMTPRKKRGRRKLERPTKSKMEINHITQPSSPRNAHAHYFSPVCPSATCLSCPSLGHGDTSYDLDEERSK